MRPHAYRGDPTTGRRPLLQDVRSCGPARRRPLGPPERPRPCSADPPDPRSQQRIVRESPRGHGPQLGNRSGRVTGVGSYDPHEVVLGEHRRPGHPRPPAPTSRPPPRAGDDIPNPVPHPPQRTLSPAHLPLLPFPPPLL